MLKVIYRKRLTMAPRPRRNPTAVHSIQEASFNAPLPAIVSRLRCHVPERGLQPIIARSPSTAGNRQCRLVLSRKPVTMLDMPPMPVTLPRYVREYFAEIGKRGGQAGRRELTRQQVKHLVAIREAKRTAKKAGKPLLEIDRKKLALLRKPRRHTVKRLSQHSIPLLGERFRAIVSRSQRAVAICLRRRLRRIG